MVSQAAFSTTCHYNALKSPQVYALTTDDGMYLWDAV